VKIVPDFRARLPDHGHSQPRRTGALRGLENREIFKQRNDANDDDDDLGDLSHPGVERQTLNQIEHENDHKECNQDADQHG
jgi:hypothetical protein